MWDVLWKDFNTKYLFKLFQLENIRIVAKTSENQLYSPVFDQFSFILYLHKNDKGV